MIAVHPGSLPCSCSPLHIFLPDFSRDDLLTALQVCTRLGIGEIHSVNPYKVHKPMYGTYMYPYEYRLLM